MLNAQFTLGDDVFVQMASNGTQISRKDYATVTTVNVENEKKALQIGTAAIVFAGETY